MKVKPCLITITTATLLINTFLIVMLKATPELVTIPYEPKSKVVIDGVIGTDEYLGSYFETITGININWEHNGTHMYIALESPGTGWVGIGFGPINAVMEGANILVGYVNDSTEDLVLSDDFGHADDAGRPTHSNDTALGGSRDFVAEAGSQSNNKTIIEFVFPLNSGDTYDYPLLLGETYGFFVAYQKTKDDLVSYHTDYSETKDLYVEPKFSPENQPPTAIFTYTSKELTVHFIDQSQDPDGTIKLWFWNFGDGSKSTEKNPTHVYIKKGIYTVNLTVTDDNGDTDTTTKILVVPQPEEQTWLLIVQVVVVSVTIVFLLFVAIRITRRIKKRHS